MAEHAVGSTASGGDSYYFLIRRLHSLTGLVPIGVFLLFHLSANASILLSPGSPGSEFQVTVGRIQLLGPLLVPVEMVFIFLPLLFHAILGLQIFFTARSNAMQYPYGSNVRFTLQRVTGVIALLFVLYHIWQMHWLGEYGEYVGLSGGGRFHVLDSSGAPAAARTAAEVIQGGWWVAVIYTIGVVASVFHLANGIWTALITWGITIRKRTQRGVGYVCTALGIVLSLVGLGALCGFTTFDVAAARDKTAAQAVTGGGHGR